MTAIIGSIILFQNSEFIENFDLKFNKDEVLVVPVRNGDDYSLLKDALEIDPRIKSIGGSRHLMGRFWSGQEVESEQNKTQVNLFEIGENYFETVDFELLEGRKFDKNLQTDIDQSIIVNETLMREFGWTSISNKYLKFKSQDSEKEYSVIGVVKDFYYNGVWQKVGPTVLRFTSPDLYGYLSVKADHKDLAPVYAHIQNIWKQLFPNRPYEGFYQDEILAEASQVTESIKLVFMYIALMVIVTAGMGLFALVSLNVARRTKELGIRKVLGATVFHISGLISKEFVILLLIGSVLASAMGFFLVKSLMASIWDYYVNIDVFPFILSVFLMFIVALFTVSSQVISVAGANPVDSIRTE